jgi:hypothetical protein
MNPRFLGGNPRCFGGGLVLIMTMALSAGGQVQTQRSATEQQPTTQVTVERGEIVAIEGNDLVIRMEDGTQRDFHNVPESLTFMVDGQPVNIKNAKVGMKLEKQTVRTTTPRVITTVQTVQGKIWQVHPPDWLILTLDDGTNQRFDIPKGQKFRVETRGPSRSEVDAYGLKKGMTITAQKVTEVPQTVVEEEVKRTGQMPPLPLPVAADVPILIVLLPAIPQPGAPTETATAEAPPSQLPKTASNLPLVGLLGLILSLASLASAIVRRAIVRLRRLQRYAS